MTKTPKTKGTITHFLHELETPSKRLTSWEMDFLESVTDQFHHRGDLSDKQFETLERIYADRTS